MRVFRIASNGKFVKYMQTPFAIQHEEVDLGDWLESNPDGILETDSVLFIGREVFTNLGGYIDLLGLDRQGNVVVVELKRDKAPRNVIAQALEYVSFAASLEPQQLETLFRRYQQDESLSLAESHRQRFALGQDEEVSFNKDQRVVIVGQQITPGIRQTASFLNQRGVRVTCIEFTYFESPKEDRLMSQQIVVDDEKWKTPSLSTVSQRKITKEKFLAACDANGRHLYSRILAFGEESSLHVHWSAKEFSLNVASGDVRVPFLRGSLPEVHYGQTLYTTLRWQTGVAGKTALPEEAIQSLYQQAHDIGFFDPTSNHKELSFSPTRKLTESELESLKAWCVSVEKAIREHDLKS